MKMNCSGPIWLLLLFNQEGLPMHCIALSISIHFYDNAIQYSGGCLGRTVVLAWEQHDVAAATECIEL